MSDIPIKPCDKARRETCLYRIGLGAEESCTSPENVLRGCPMMKKMIGCRSSFGEHCTELLEAETKIKNGERVIEKFKCVHHIDNVVKMYEQAGIKKRKIGAPPNGSVQAEASLEEDSFDEFVEDE